MQKTLNFSLFLQVMSEKKKIYFASDFHLGAFPYEQSIEREKSIVRWLDSIKEDCAELYLLGDIFDFWFEYKKSIPKGYSRFLGKLAEFSDLGIPITFFKGNHDMWMFGYLKEELGARIIDNELILERNGKRFYLHHGDGLGPGDATYKFLKKFFRSQLCQWLFARLHPNLGISLAQKWSKKSRITSGKKETYLGDDKEWLIQYINEYEEKRPLYIDYFVFGHRHLALNKKLKSNTQYVNLGEWMLDPHFAYFDGDNLQLIRWEDPKFPKI